MIALSEIAKAVQATTIGHDNIVNFGHFVRRARSDQKARPSITMEAVLIRTETKCIVSECWLDVMNLDECFCERY